MLVVVSPAKKMNMEPAKGLTPTAPAFGEDAKALAQVARDLSKDDLKKLMHISDDLAQLNADRFAAFGTQDQKPAALAFAGDTYKGLEAETLDEDALRWAQDHLRILSGLYGVLRPLDQIEPYRLEMGSKLKTAKGKSLYDYWGDRLAKALNEHGEQAGTDILINCASQEYFGAVDQKALTLRVITPTFLDTKKGEAKVISFYAKQARGAMARFIVQNRLTDLEALKEFDTGGYAYQPDRSTEDAPVFLRPEQ